MSRAWPALLAALLTPMAFGAAQQQDPGPCDPVLIDLTELIPQPEPPPPPQPECRSLVFVTAVGTDEAGQAATRAIFLSPAGYAPVLVVLDPDTGFPGETLDLGLASIDCLSASDGGQSVFVVSGGVLYTYLPVLDLGVLSLQLLSSVVVGPVDDVIGRPGTSDAVVIGDDVTIVDGGTGTVIDSVFLGGDPFAAAFLSDPSRLVVTLEDGRIALVKLDPLGVVGTKPIGSDLGGVAVCEPEGEGSDIIFVSDLATNTITALDASTMTVVDVVDATSPGGIETGETGPASVDLAFVMEEGFISVRDCNQDKPTYLDTLVEIVLTGTPTTVVLGPEGTNIPTFVGEQARTEVLVLNPGCITNAPRVDSISPLGGVPGTVVSIKGQLTDGTHIIIGLNGTPLAYLAPLSLTATEATFEVPLGIAAGLALEVFATESSEQAVMEAGNYLRSPPREFETLAVTEAIEGLINDLQVASSSDLTPAKAKKQIDKAIEQLQKVLEKLAKGDLAEALAHFKEALEHLQEAIDKGGDVALLARRLLEIVQFLLFEKLSVLTATLGEGHPLLADAQTLFDIGRGALLSGDLETALDAFADAVEELNEATQQALVFQADEALETLTPLVISLLQTSWKIHEAWVSTSKTDQEAADALLKASDRLVGPKRNLADSVISDFGQGRIEEGFDGLRKVLQHLEEAPEPIRTEISTEIVQASLGFAGDVVARAETKVGSLESIIIKALERLLKVAQLLLQKDFLGAILETFKAIEEFIEGLIAFYIELEQGGCDVDIDLEQPDPICQGETATFKGTLSVNPPPCAHVLIRLGVIWSKSTQKFIRLFDVSFDVSIESSPTSGPISGKAWDGKDKDGNEVDERTVEVWCIAICLSVCAPPDYDASVKELEIVPDGDCTIKPANKTICVGEDVKIELVVCQDGKPVKVPEAQTKVQVIPAFLGSVSGSTFTGGSAGSGTIVATDIKTGKTCQTKIDVVDEKPRIVVHNLGQACEGGSFDFDLFLCKNGTLQKVDDSKADWLVVIGDDIATIDPLTGILRVFRSGTIEVGSAHGGSLTIENAQVFSGDFDTLVWVDQPAILMCGIHQFSAKVLCGSSPVEGVFVQAEQDIPSEFVLSSLFGFGDPLEATNAEGIAPFTAVPFAVSEEFLGTWISVRAGNLRIYAPTTAAKALMEFGAPLDDGVLCVGDTAPVTIKYLPDSPVEIVFYFESGAFSVVETGGASIAGESPLTFDVTAVGLGSSGTGADRAIVEGPDATACADLPCYAFKVSILINNTASTEDDYVFRRVDPSEAAGFVVRNAGHIRVFQVRIEGSLGTGNKTFTLSSLRGTGQPGEVLLSSAQIVTGQAGTISAGSFQGITTSSSVQDGGIRVIEAGSEFVCAEQRLTVPAIEITLRTAGSASSDNDARESFVAGFGDAFLGIHNRHFGIGGFPTGIYYRVEMLGQVSPSDFVPDPGTIKFVQFVTTRAYKNGDELPNTRRNAEPDPQPAASLDLTPSETGRVYLLDSPSIVLDAESSFLVGLYRGRWNFVTWVEADGLRASNVVPWFVRQSALASGPVNSPNFWSRENSLGDDNKAGVGSTKLGFDDKQQ